MKFLIMCIELINTESANGIQKSWIHLLLQRYADAVANKGAPLQNCFGFIDGTVSPIARPDTNQRIVYKGHKRVHAIKFQSVTLPNGIIGHLYGPTGKGIFFFAFGLFNVTAKWTKFQTAWQYHF